MKLKSIKFLFAILLVAMVVIACEEDDTVTPPEFVERDRTEQQVEDDSTLVAYLSTHYYNSAFIAAESNPKYTDIIISELPEGETEAPADHTMLIDAVETRTTTYLDVDYKYYVLNLNQGGGESPNFTDRVFMRYEGTSVNTEEVFDVVASPIALNLQGNFFSTFGVIRGWQLVIPDFNTATDYSIENGFVNYSDFGFGVMFLPSGLGYFSGTQTGDAYDNLMFKFELIRYEEVDHDSDGIPSYMEDLDSSLEVTDDDSDEDDILNFIDPDDDNDGVNTIDELISNTYTQNATMQPFATEMEAKEYYDNNLANTELFDSIELDSESGTYELNTFTVADSNSNGTPDYLEADIAVNYNENDE